MTWEEGESSGRSPRSSPRRQIFASGAALGQGASQPSVQSERQQVAGFIQLLKADRADGRAERSSINTSLDPKYRDMLEALRANRGISEDEVKRADALRNAMRDATLQYIDRVSSFLHLMQSISTRIHTR